MTARFKNPRRFMIEVRKNRPAAKLSDEDPPSEYLQIIVLEDGSHPAEIQQQTQSEKRIATGHDIIEHDTNSARQLFQSVDGKWFGYIEEAKKQKAPEENRPPERSKKVPHQETDDFIDDNDLRIFLS
jgi:hypothetical protein